MWQGRPLIFWRSVIIARRLPGDKAVAKAARRIYAGGLRVLHVTRPGQFPMEPGLEFARGFTVAPQAERPHVVEVALAAAFGHRDAMVGVPKTLAGESLQPPGGKQFQTPCPARPLQRSHRGNGVRATPLTYAAVTGKDPIAEMARIAAQLPLFHAPVGAERSASLGDLQVAPAAQRAAPLSLRQFAGIHPTAGHSPPLAKLPWRGAIRVVFRHWK